MEVPEVYSLRAAAQYAGVSWEQLRSDLRASRIVADVRIMRADPRSIGGAPGFTQARLDQYVGMRRKAAEARKAAGGRA